MCLVLAAIVVTFVIMILRFTGTCCRMRIIDVYVPVKPSQHIISKLIVSMIWNIGTLCCGLFLLAMLKRDNLESLRKYLTDYYGLRRLRRQVWPVIAEYAILLLVGTVMQILMIYASIAIGHLYGTQGNRFLCGLSALIPLFR